MNFRSVFVVAVHSIFIFCGVSVLADSVTISIPKAGFLGGRPVPSGIYTVEIDEMPDKPYLRLIQKGKMIATDLAIVLPARGAGKTSVRLTKTGRKEFIRVQARHGDQWFFVYIETASTSRNR